MSDTRVPLSIGGAPAGTDRTVRPALPSDAHAIAHLQYEALRHFVSHALKASHDKQDVPQAGEELLPPVDVLVEQWQATLSAPPPPGCATFVAIHGTEVGAFALALPGQTMPEIPGHRQQIPEGTDIASLVVRPEFQRSGHGSRLLSAVVDTLPTANVRMWIEADDDVRQRFAQSAGFAPAGVRRQIDVGDVTVTEHLWWATLK